VNYNRNTARQKQVDGGAPSTDKLFRNNGNGTFTNVSKEAGITIEGFGLGVSVCDLNSDGWPDIYVSNDFLTNDLVWMNNGNGTFTNQAETMLRHTTYNAMGNDVADFNNDGKEDIVEVDMLPPDNKRWKLTMLGNTYEQFQQDLSFGYQPQYVRNTLQLNNGNGTFSEIGQLAGVSATEWSWAPLLADFDNDGLKDLFVTNGYRQDITNLDFIMYGKQALFVGTPEANRKERMAILKKYEGIKVPNYLFKNGGNLTFSNVATQWGLDDATYANGAAYGDLDNDGDLDLIVNNLDQPVSVYENESNKLLPDAKWLRLRFEGPSGNREGLGTKVYLWQGNSLQYQYFSPYRGYLSTVEPYVHFGLHNAPVDSLKVVGPDGHMQLLKNISSNQLLTLIYNDAHVKNDLQLTPAIAPLFTPYNNETGIAYKHSEDEFVDFKLQPLLPHLESHEGPGLSSSDVNGDGLDDLLVGGGAGSHATLFLQQKNGKFKPTASLDSNVADNMGVLFFDADGDGDQDLYVANGGMCEKKNGDPVYQHRFYLNDGKGNFTKAESAIPRINTSGSCVVAGDYDHDGDLDLFVGGRVSPGEYPLPPQSYILRNDSQGGVCHFTDVTKQLCPKLNNMGMVTSALWSDYDNDGWQDLVVVGEFMPITFIHNEGGKTFSNPHSIEHSSGWWNSIVAGDFDHDGDIDYIAGNLGLNGPYKASPKEPVCIYAKDYDKNGRIDPIMCHYQNGEEYTVHSRDDINKQITPMRARFRDYTSYASVNFKESFRRDEIQDAYIVRCETFASAYMENKGKGVFSLHSLPIEAQFAPIYGMVCRDVNSDGNLDVICVGNSYATEVQTGRYDAQGSFVLLGNGARSFQVDRKSLNCIGDNKAVVELRAADGRTLLFISSNSDSLHVFSFADNQQKSVAVNSDETYAVIKQRNGKTYRQEFYFSNSYLSQSTRRFSISADVTSVTFYNVQGEKRTVNF